MFISALLLYAVLQKSQPKCRKFINVYSPPPPHTLGAEVFFMESLTPFIRHELEDAPGPSGPPEETSSVVSPPLGAIPGQPPVTEPPKPGCGSQQPPSQPDGPDVQLPPPEVPQPRPDCSIQHPGQVVLHTTSQSASQTAPLVGEPLAKRRGFTKCQSLPSVGATTTTAASGGNRESLLGPRPVRRKRSAADAGCRNPGSGSA